MHSNSFAPYVSIVAKLVVQPLSIAELVDLSASGAVKTGTYLGNGGKQVEVNNPFSNETKPLR